MTAKIFNFTKAALTALKPGSTRQYYQDTKELRLGVYVTPAGSKSYFARLTIDGKTVRRTLGKFPDLSIPLARKKAIEAASVVAQGNDPLEQKRGKQTANVTLKQVLDAYLSSHELKASTVKDYRRAIGTVAPDWLGRPLNSITEKKVLARYLEQGKTSKARTDNGFRVLRALFNFAAVKYKRTDSSSYFPENPTSIIKTSRVRFKPVKRRNLVTDERMPVLFDVLRQMDNPIARECLQFILLTGCRHSEATSLAWGNVNLKAGTFHLPDPKNRNPVTLPLPGIIKTLLAARIKPDGYVFPSPTGSQPIDLRPAVKEIKAATYPDFIIHDLRRTFISQANALDISHYTVKALVNHTISGTDITAGYDVPSLDRLKAASVKIQNKLLSLATGENQNVVRLAV